jgi:hypothetical protein
MPILENLFQKTEVTTSQLNEFSVALISISEKHQTTKMIIFMNQKQKNRDVPICVIIHIYMEMS